MGAKQVREMSDEWTGDAFRITRGEFVIETSYDCHGAHHIVSRGDQIIAYVNGDIERAKERAK